MSPRFDGSARGADGSSPLRLKSLAELESDYRREEEARENFAPIAPSETLELVIRAAQTIERLRQRSDDIESFAASVAQQTKEEFAAMTLQMEECRQRAMREEARAEEAERRLSDAERRADEASRLALHAATMLSELQIAIVRRLAPFCDKDRLDVQAEFKKGAILTLPR